jgi:hypothetical protein
VIDIQTNRPVAKKPNYRSENDLALSAGALLSGWQFMQAGPMTGFGMTSGAAALLLWLLATVFYGPVSRWAMFRHVGAGMVVLFIVAARPLAWIAVRLWGIA